MASLRRQRISLFVLLLAVLSMEDPPLVHSWTEHPLISYQVLVSLPEVREAGPVRVEPLESFLLEEEEGVRATLAEVEVWAKRNLAHYQPLPSALALESRQDFGDITQRFCHAIRINPSFRFPLYLQLIPGITAEGTPVSVNDISPLRDTSDWEGTRFVQLQLGDVIPAVLVITTATDEPDLGGLDVGLYEDNGTSHGRLYGWGRQPFGNPNIEYGSQAPFHMGFYHETWLVNTLGGFIKKTYPEYRIYLYHRLARLAFATGHEYWGWRFLGIGLHYVMDLTQPYHTTLMPGDGILKMLSATIVALLGIETPKKAVIQILSNRHTALEKLLQQLLEEAYVKQDFGNPIFYALRTSGQCAPWNDRMPRDVISAYSNARAAVVDKTLQETLPERFVKDPTVEIATVQELKQILALTRKKAGQVGIAKIEALIAELLAPLPSYACSYVRSAIGG